MASNNHVPETNQPIYHWASTPEQKEHPCAFTNDATHDTDSVDDTTFNKSPVADTDAWEASIFACCTSPSHLFAAVVLPCASAYYSARGINKFPIAIGIAVAVFFYGTMAFIALTVIEGDDQPATTIGGMEFKAWQTGAGWALVNFFGIVFMLRGWFRSFHEIRGNKFSDCAVSFGFSCCALAQMSKHTAAVRAKGQQHAVHTSTLPGYGV